MNETQKETYGRGFFVAVLVAVSVLSVIGNMAYASKAAPLTDSSLSSGWAALGHAMIPILLLAMTEVLALATRKFRRGRGRTFAQCGVAVIALAAFAMSFAALHEFGLMLRVHDPLAYLVPVVLDVAIVVCTALVLMASEEMRRDREAAAAADAAAEQAVVEPVAVPPTVADSTPVAANAPVVGQPLPTVGVPVVDRQWVTDEPLANVVGVGDTVDAPATGDVDAVADGGFAQVSVDDGGYQPPMAEPLTPSSSVDDGASTSPVAASDTAVDEPLAADDGVAIDSGVIVDEPAIDTSLAANEAATGRQSVADNASTVAVDGVDIDALAVDVVADTNTKIPVDDVARALVLRYDGTAFGAIAKELGVGSHSTVSGLVKAAVAMDTAYAAAVGQPHQRPLQVVHAQ